MFVITGASSGIGYATAKELAFRGEHVLGVARDVNRLEALKQFKPDAITVLTADLTDTSGLNQLFNALQNIDRIDGLVHAAGSAVELGEYIGIDELKLQADLAVHVTAPLALNKQLKDKLLRSRIVFIDSYSASTPRVGWAGYSIVKAAAQMAARCAAAEMPQTHVIRVFPGGVRTPLVDAVLASSIDSPTVQAFRAMDTEGKIVEPDVTGTYLADLLLKATDEQLAAREVWDFNNPRDRV